MAVFNLGQGEGALAPAPDWFVDWVRLGMLAARWCSPDAEPERRVRRVLVASAPTDAVASAAIAFGFVRSAYVSGISNDCTTRIDQLEDIERDTWIWLRAAHTTRIARLLSVDARVLRTSNGHFRRDLVSEVRRLPEWLCGEETTGDCDSAVNEPFLRHMLRGSDPLAFATTWDTSLALIGSRTALNEELGLQVAAAEDGAPAGSLRQIVRPLDLSVPIGCRSVISSPRDDEPAWSRWPKAPALTILRGSYATSRWLPDVASPTVICILGRSELGLDAAVAAVLQARAYGDPLGAEALGWRAPRGCELLAFEEAA